MLWHFCPARTFVRCQTGAGRVSIDRATATMEPSLMNVHLNIVVLQPAIALIAGILILVVPRLLNVIVAIYLIVLGLTGLFPQLFR
jgi:hypothetical protein